jgi:phage tail sheath gpL-like
MAFQPTNPDLSLGNQRPGVYVAVNLNAPGGGVGDISRRMLIAAYKQASGTAPQDAPFQPLSLSDVQQGCGGQSDAVRGYEAAIAEVGAGNIDIFVLPLAEPSGGTASTYNLIVGFSSGTTAAAPGSVDFSMDGRPILSVPFSVGDTAGVIAANIKSAIALISDCPLTAGSISGGTIPLTYVHKGDVGEDCPMRAQVNGTGTLVTLSPGAILFAGTTASGAGSIQVVVGAITITAALAGGETPAQCATKLVAAINGGSYPFTAVVDSGTPAQVDLLFAPGRDSRRYTCAIITSTGITASTTSGGTAGAGQPSLTAAIANLQALPGFAGWSVPFTGTQAIPDTATLGTIATNIELRANGIYQQEQRIHACVSWPSSIAGNIPTGTSPALTTSPRYAMMWCQDAGVQGFEIACRMAAARVNNDYAAKNWDGYQFHSSTQSPLPLPAAASRPSGDVINVAMRSFFLCPVRVDGATNTLVLEKGTTTSNSSYMPLRDFATIDQIAYWRKSLRERLVQKFKAISAKQFSAPKTPNTISAAAVADEAYILALEWDDQDLYDGAETFKAGFQSSFNVSNPTRIDLSFPLSPVLNVHQIGAVGNLVSPST